MQAYNADAGSCWIAGVSFGAWIAMQLLMRRPEVEGFISVALPANLYDFTFLAPCPSSGLMVNGARDRVVPTESVRGLVDRLKTQKGIVIDHATVPEANHFFEGRMDGLMEVVDAYLDKRLDKKKKRETAGQVGAVFPAPAGVLFLSVAGFFALPRGGSHGQSIGMKPPLNPRRNPCNP